MKIVFAASEMRPFAETGGLANVVSSLAFALARQGHDVRVFLPRYHGISNRKFKLYKIADPLLVPLARNREHVRLYETELKGVRVYLIEQSFFYDRPGLYGDKNGDYEDNEVFPITDPKKGGIIWGNLRRIDIDSENRMTLRIDRNGDNHEDLVFDYVLRGRGYGGLRTTLTRVSDDGDGNGTYGENEVFYFFRTGLR